MTTTSAVGNTNRARVTIVFLFLSAPAIMVISLPPALAASEPSSVRELLDVEGAMS